MHFKNDAATTTTTTTTITVPTAKILRRTTTCWRQVPVAAELPTGRQRPCRAQRRAGDDCEQPQWERLGGAVGAAQVAGTRWGSRGVGDPVGTQVQSGTPQLYLS